jgi:hypothetical protein
MLNQEVRNQRGDRRLWLSSRALVLERRVLKTFGHPRQPPLRSAATVLCANGSLRYSFRERGKYFEQAGFATTRLTDPCTIRAWLDVTAPLHRRDIQAREPRRTCFAFISTGGSVVLAFSANVESADEGSVATADWTGEDGRGAAEREADHVFVSAALLER